MKKYDYLIVGAGLFGAVFAHEASRRGKTCLVIDKKNHIGGNIYTEEVEGIQVHRYGAHIFHTSRKQVWDYINQFAEFNHFVNSPIAIYKDELYNLVDNNLKIENTVDSNKYAEYTRLHIKCKNNVTEILKVISPKTEQAIRTRFSDFQDEFSKLVYETGTLEDMKKAIIENETKLLEILYKYEIF